MAQALDFEAIRATARRPACSTRAAAFRRTSSSASSCGPTSPRATATTQTSGRGIGLDAVNSAVNELGGAVSLDSQPARGCSVELRLPVSLISSHALLVRVGPYRLAVAIAESARSCTRRPASCAPSAQSRCSISTARPTRCARSPPCWAWDPTRAPRSGTPGRCCWFRAAAQPRRSWWTRSSRAATWWSRTSAATSPSCGACWARPSSAMAA